jgi:D-glycero-alpha-D-manno-heptose-7-phosphate kinase
MGIDDGIEMVHTSDLPARSGIGSSSAFTVGFLNTLAALKGQMVTKRQLAGNAIHVEQKMINENVGSQDQVAVSFGGLNRIDFNGKENFLVQPVTIGHRKIELLQDHLLFFFTGISRTASEIAGKQIKSISQKENELRSMHQMVDEAVNILNGREEDIGDFGKLLGESWKLKRSLTDDISTQWVDEMYEAAISAGALGGKLCGAGGGGFLLLFVPPERQGIVKEKLEKSLYVPFSFESLGSQIILYERREVN